jgi:hypothetical protein
MIAEALLPVRDYERLLFRFKMLGLKRTREFNWKDFTDRTVRVYRKNNHPYVLPITSVFNNSVIDRYVAC